MAGYDPAYQRKAKLKKLCEPVNIHVFRNGKEGEKPQLVHIPVERRKKMSTILEEIQSRMRFPVGYPVALFNLDGTKVRKPWQLEMYNNYVVTTNLDKKFRCVQYGLVKDPLVVVTRYSKHVKALDLECKRFDLFCSRRKMIRTPLHELVHSKPPAPCCSPAPIDVSSRIGNSRQTQCCADEIICIEQPKCPDDTSLPAVGQNRRPECDLLDLSKKVDQAQTRADSNLIDLIQRYKQVGSNIFKVFQDKISKEARDEFQFAPPQPTQRWQYPEPNPINNNGGNSNQALNERLQQMPNLTTQHSLPFTHLQTIKESDEALLKY